MGGTLTVPEVLDWDPAALAQDADRVHQVGDRLEDIVDELVRTRAHMADEWLGRAGEAAERSIRQRTTTGQELRDVVQRAERALDAGYHRLRAVRHRLESAVEAAERDGCTVGPDGSVTPPPVPPLIAPADLPAAELARLQQEYDQRVAEAHRLAERHAAAVGGALDDARVADETTAEELRSVHLPDGVAARLADTALESERVVFPADWSPLEAFRVVSASKWETMVGIGAKCFLSTHLTDNNDSVADYAHTGYYGGGFIKGPDGELYPLVVPRVVEDGEAYGGTFYPTEDGPENLGGADDGWETIGVDTGYEQLEEVSEFNQGAILFSSTFGGGAPQPAGEFIRRPDLEQELSVGPTGLPTLTSETHPTTASSSRPPPEPPTTVAQAPGYYPDRMDRVGGLVDLGISAAEGIQTSQSIEQDAHHPYVLRLQEHEDGRQRAILNLYSVLENKETGRIRIDSSHGWLDQDGDLRLAPIEFRHPDHAVISAPVPAYDVDPDT